jgi:hypothetical protein
MVVNERPNIEEMYMHRTRIFEDRIVSMVCNAIGLTSYLSSLRKRTEIEFGTRLLSLKHFHSWHPDFPVLLAVPKNTLTFDFGCNLCWSNFRKNPLYAAYLNHFDTTTVFRTRKYFGLVFLAGFHSSFIMHNDFPRDRTGEMETRIEKIYGRRRTKFVIEPFNLFVKSIPPTWHQGAGENS